MHDSSARPTLIYRPDCWVEPLRWAALFPAAAPIEVEIGSGDGSFLADWAAARPHRNFLGVERLLGRLRKLDRKALRARLDNLRLLRIEAGYFMSHLLPPASIDALHVYFPDPWPKRKHRANRLINDPFTILAARALTPGGFVFLRTDDADYFNQMQIVFGANQRFAACPTPEPLKIVRTDFERAFHRAGIDTRHAAYQLV